MIIDKAMLMTTFTALVLVGVVGSDGFLYSIVVKSVKCGIVHETAVASYLLCTNPVVDHFLADVS
jgi:hypothetical protein